jgi:hypothetical protein
MWAYLESLNWKKNMLPLLRVMAHYELLEKQLASERARADHELKERCKIAIDHNFLKLALDTERALADRLAAVAKDCRPFCEPMRRRLIDEVIAAWKEARRA